MNIISSANFYCLTAITIVLFSITACTTENTTSQNNNIPTYEILDTVDLINGNKFAEILITSFSKETSQQELETTAKKIAEEINVDEVDIYCSKEAQKANYSDSFSKEHPNAIEECYLGNFK